MSLKLYPDFDVKWKIGDRLITEQTVQLVNGKLAIKITSVVFSPAGSKAARSVIFVDTTEPVYLEEI